MIRYVKIPLGNDLHGPKDDLPGTDWMSLTEETAPSFSALAYFFAKEMYRETQVPVGIVNSSWGGSSVEAWMSEEPCRSFRVSCTSVICLIRTSIVSCATVRDR